MTVAGVRVGADGDWLTGVRRALSPHRDARPADCAVDLLVVHGISLPPGEFGGPWIEELFLGRLDPEADPYFREIAGLRVSAHVLVRRDGTTIQFVPFSERAWHAGESSHEGRPGCNDFSIGIELEGIDDLPYEAAQYARLAEIARALFVAWPRLDPSRIVGHCDVAPGRKTDPGAVFDWQRLARDLDAG